MRHLCFSVMALLYGTLGSGQAAPSGPPVAAPLMLRLSFELSSWQSSGASGGAVAVSSPELSAAPSRALAVWVARVLPGDAQVQGAQAALAVAEARYRQARSRLFPNLGLQAVNGRSTDLDGRFSVERSTRRVEASVRWNLYDGGADHAGMAAAQWEVVAAEADLRRAREESAERLAQAYFDLLRLERMRSSAKERLADVMQLVAQVARQSEAGKLSELDLQQAQNAGLEAELALDALDSDYHSAQIRLRLLGGGQLPEEIADFSLQGISVSDTARNAQLVAAQARAAAARLRVRNLAETLAPKIDLDVRHLLNNRTTPPQSTVQQHGWSIGVSWDWPLGGENLARRDESRARARQADADIAQAELAARAEFEALTPRIANFRRALQNLAVQEKKMAQLAGASAIQFEAGRRTLQQIIQGRDSYFTLQQRRLEQHHRLLLAQIRQLALGGHLLESLD